MTKRTAATVSPMQVGAPPNLIFGSTYCGRDSANIPMPANLQEKWPDVDAYPLAMKLGELLQTYVDGLPTP